MADRPEVRAAVGDRGEDLVLKELLRDTDFAEVCAGGIDDMVRKYAEVGLSPPVRAPVDGSDRAPAVSCDQCGKPGAKLKCSKCGSAYYCGKQCQVAAWRAGHKSACATFREDCERDGAECVAALKGSGGSGPLGIIGPPGQGITEYLGLLDKEGAYAVAVRRGLFPALTALLRDDVNIAARWAGGIITSNLHHITTSVFRGQRHRTDGGFGAADGDRFSAYLRAELAGWSTLLSAACAVATLAMCDPVHPRFHMRAHMAARDCWSFFSLALVHESVARAIFGVPKPAPASASSSAASAAEAVDPGPTEAVIECDRLLEEAVRLHHREPRARWHHAQVTHPPSAV